MSKEFVHVTKNRERIPLSEMGDDHLKNTIKFLQRRAKEGVMVRNGGGSGPEDYWYEEYMVYGEEALHKLGFRHYAAEAARRWGAKA